MEFPILLYKTPGPYSAHGVSYRYIGCPDEASYERLTGEGWVVSLWDDKETAKVTRAEMLQKAKELGIKGAHLMKDDTLLAKIEAAL